MTHDAEPPVDARPIAASASHMHRTRLETAADVDLIRAINVAAFGRPDEARMVDALREAGALARSLVAVDDGGQVLGHLALSAITVDGEPAGLGLAPMAVAPGHQRGGVGSALVRAALAGCRAERVPLVVVLGRPAFYPRFGFVPARTLGLRWEGGHDDAFFALALTSPVARGTVRYRPEIA